MAKGERSPIVAYFLCAELVADGNELTPASGLLSRLSWTHGQIDDGCTREELAEGYVDRRQDDFTSIRQASLRVCRIVFEPSR